MLDKPQPNSRVRDTPASRRHQAHHNNVCLRVICEVSTIHIESQTHSAQASQPTSRAGKQPDLARSLRLAHPVARVSKKGAQSGRPSHLAKSSTGRFPKTDIRRLKATKHACHRRFRDLSNLTTSIDWTCAIVRENQISTIRHLLAVLM